MKIVFYTVGIEEDYMTFYADSPLNVYLEASPRAKFWPWIIPTSLAVL